MLKSKKESFFSQQKDKVKMKSITLSYLGKPFMGIKKEIKIV